MSRTLVSPRRHISSSVCRSRCPSAVEATSLGRRNPRSRKRGGFILRFLGTDASAVNSEVEPGGIKGRMGLKDGTASGVATGSGIQPALRFWQSSQKKPVLSVRAGRYRSRFRKWIDIVAVRRLASLPVQPVGPKLRVGLDGTNDPRNHTNEKLEISCYFVDRFLFCAYLGARLRGKLD
jgi:hypothetical protein